MNINLNFEDIPDDLVDGEYALCDLSIYLEKSLTYRTMRLLVIHAIVENFCQPWPHDKVDELVEHIQVGLDALDEHWQSTNT